MGGFKGRSIIFFLVTSIFLIFQSAYAVNIDRIIVFGDSLSDNGNIYSLTKKLHKVMPLIPILPKGPPYYEGRFSNGPVWIDDLAASMDVPLDDYAYGGAWAEPLLDSKLAVPFGIGMQVNYYLVTNVLDRHRDDHLYVIWAGGNDYVQGRTNVEYATDNTVASIRSNLEWLVYYGAKNVLIMNLPDLSVVPEVKAEGPDKVQNVQKLISLHNAKLAKMVKEVQADNPEAKIIFADITSYFEDAYEHPKRYHLKNVKKSCYDGGYSLRQMQGLINSNEIAAAKKENIDILRSPSLKAAYLTSKLADAGAKSCANPDEYMFWDQIHPTRIVHNLMALDAMTIMDKNGFKGVRRAKN